MKVISSKIKGVFSVTMSNIISLGISLITSFILPIFISVEEYGFWQLFVLYNSYVGFFVLGFNDGVHLNYATFDYDSALASKFRSFKLFLTILTLIESIILLIACFFVFSVDSKNFYISVLVILNIFPSAIIGLFTYLNQSTLRFKQYSVGNIVDKIVFTILMCLLLIIKEKDSIIYISAFTISRYAVLIYHYCTSKEVFVQAREPFFKLKDEIIKNFKDGFPLMIACIVGGPSIIVGSRFLIQAAFGIETFSAYSFSLHTLVIASQFISAVATVFYPILKRCPKDELRSQFSSFDKMTTLAAALLLFTYFPAALLVNVIYSKYVEILDYLFIIYPLFIYQCKSNMLIVNMYKVNNKPIRLIGVNLLGIVIHLLSIFIAYYLIGSVTSIAAATLLSFVIWYYITLLFTYKSEKWSINFSMFLDLIIVSIFIILNLFMINVFGVGNRAICYTSLFMLLIGILFIIIYFNKLRFIVREFVMIMKD